MFEYRKATIKDLNKIWDKDIKSNNNDERYLRWKEEYINNNKTEKCATFVVVKDDDPVGQVTVIFSPKCSAVINRQNLCDGKTIANMNAFRIEKEYEGKGHISKLVRLAENYAKEKGIKKLTIGCEANQTRNLAIYLHFGYNEFVTSEVQENELVLYYSKNI